MLFISHRSTDKAAALDLYQRAIDQGYSAAQLFLDSDPESGIAAGQDWEQVLYDRLKRSRALIVLCSPSWLTSQWCFVELGYAKSMAMSIFPMLIEKCDVGSVLNVTQAVDLSQVQGEAAKDAAYEGLWKALRDQHLGPQDNLPWPPVGDEDVCPFPGMLAFDEKYAPVYFGREQERDQVVAELKEMRDQGVPRLLMIVGGSGSGKSSLLRAGVLPWLKHKNEASDWLVLPTLRYGQTPSDDLTLLGVLAQELAARFPADAPQRPDWKDLRGRFESDDVEQAARDFFDVTQDLTMARGCPGATILLAIDQFEELLTAAARPSAEQFLRFLKTLLSRNNGRLLVIGTMRSDYLDVYEQHAHALLSPYFHTYRLPPFPWERVADVIVKPAERAGVKFTDELVERLKRDAPTGDALPLLAFTLEKLFRQCAGDKRVTLREYEQLGGMTGAIKQAVARILPDKLPPEVENDLRLSFVRHLAQVNEKDEFVRRPARWSQLPVLAQPLLEQFVRERLLHTSGEGAGKSVEVSHEALFRSWDQLSRWLQEAGRVLRWRRDVERDRKADSWSGLTRPQLAVARTWPKKRRDELSSEEITWINRGIRRERVFRGVVAAVVLLIASLGTWAWYQKTVADTQTAIAKSKTDEAVEANSRMLQQLHVASMADLANGLKAWQEDYDAIQKGKRAESIGGTSKWHEAVAYFTRALELEPENAQAAYWLYSTLLHRGHENWNLPLHELRHESVVTATSFSPDGSKVVTACGGGSASSGYGQIWDVVTGHAIGEPLQHEGVVRAASFSPDGSKVVTASDDTTARIWDTGTGKAIGEPLRHEDKVCVATVSPDGSKIVTASDDNTARIWDAASAKPVGAPLRHEDKVCAASFSPDGSKVVTASHDKTARIWDVTASQAVGEPLRHEEIVWAASFSPEGSRVITASADRTARIWDAASRQAVGEPLRHQEMVLAARFSPDGSKVVTASWDQTARIWDAATGKAIGAELRHESVVFVASFSPDGSKVLTASYDKTARLWEAPSGKPIGEPLRHEENLTAANFSPDGAKVVTASCDMTARIWDAPTRKLLGEPLRHEGRCSAADFSPDGSKLVTGGYDTTAQIWDAASGRPVGEPFQHAYEVLAASFSPDGSKVVTCCGAIVDTRGYAEIWDVATRKPIGERLRHDDDVTCASFSSDGSRVVTASYDKTAQIWDVGSGNRIGEPLRHEDRVTAASFSPDGSRVVTASYDKTARIWDAATAKRMGETLTHENPVLAARFSPDGSKVVTGGIENCARIWDAASRKPVGERLRHTDFVRHVAFSRDGSKIVTASDDNTARIWETASGRPVGEPLRHDDTVLAANFSPCEEKIVTASSDMTARIWDVGTDEERAKMVPISPLVLDWARAIAGLRFGKDGELQIIPLMERQPTVTSAGLPTGPWAELAQWLNTRGPNRKLSPDSPHTLRQIAERERDFGWRKSLESALSYDPTTPLARLVLAGVLEEDNPPQEEADHDASVPTCAAILRSIELTCLRDDAKLWARAAEILLQSPDANVGIGPRATTAREEALKAARKAIELDPQLPAAQAALKKAQEVAEQGSPK